jgi:hypothetical protein
MTTLPKQNLTISLGVDIIRKAKILAAQRSTSISGLLAQQVEALVHADDAYNRAAISAIARMNRGLRLGGGTMTSREKLHER